MKVSIDCNNDSGLMMVWLMLALRIDIAKRILPPQVVCPPKLFRSCAVRIKALSLYHSCFAVVFQWYRILKRSLTSARSVRPVGRSAHPKSPNRFLFEMCDKISSIFRSFTDNGDPGNRAALKFQTLKFGV